MFEVLEPTTQYRVELGHDVFHRVSVGAFGQLPHPVFELAQVAARPAADPPSTNLAFTVPEDFFTGADQLLRVQIDGAESPLVADGSGLYVDPRIEITP